MGAELIVTLGILLHRAVLGNLTHQHGSLIARPFKIGIQVCSLTIHPVLAFVAGTYAH